MVVPTSLPEPKSPRSSPIEPGFPLKKATPKDAIKAPSALSFPICGGSIVEAEAPKRDKHLVTIFNVITHNNSAFSY